MTKKNITLLEAEIITGINKRTLLRMCKAGEIAGAEYVLERFWSVPREWAEARRPQDDPEDYSGYMTLPSAATLADVTREAMRQAIERGDVIGKLRKVNKRGRWWVKTSDESFGKYMSAARDRKESRWNPDRTKTYSFHDFIVDRKLLAKGEPTLADERVLWDAHGDEYKDYCRENEYIGEDLSNL